MGSTPQEPEPSAEDPRESTADSPHPAAPFPHTPYPGAPYPGAPYPGGHGSGGWTPPEPARRGLSFGAGLGIGTAIGVVAHGIGVAAMFAFLEALGGAGGLLGFLWPFLLIAAAAGVMMFFAPTRSFATGILIIAAAMWLVIIGPCIALVASLSG